MKTYTIQNTITGRSFQARFTERGLEQFLSVSFNVGLSMIAK